MCSGIIGVFVAGGIDKAVTKRLTLAADIQRLRVDIEAWHGDVSGFTQTVPLNAVIGERFVELVERAHTATLSLTGKFNAWGNLLVTFTGLIPANRSGLTDRFTPIVGLDYAW